MHLKVLCDIFDENCFATTECACENVYIMWVFNNGINICCCLLLNFIMEMCGWNTSSNGFGIGCI